MTVTDEEEAALTRAQKRYLRRIFNGRTVPIVVAGTALITYKDACRFLLSLEPAPREAVYQAMKEQVKSASPAV